MIFSKNHFTQVKKRDGRIVLFDENRILSAVAKAMSVTGEGSRDDAQKVAEEVVAGLNKKFPAEHIPTIEEVQDAVETELIVMDFAKTAKAYILYRSDRSQIRERKREIPERVRERYEAWLLEQENAGVEFTPEQLAWLERIRDTVASSLGVARDDFEYPPFVERGGLGKAYELFGERLDPLLAELTEVLAA